MASSNPNIVQRIDDWRTYNNSSNKGLLGLTAMAWFWPSSCPSFFDYTALDACFNRDSISQDWKNTVCPDSGPGGLLATERKAYVELNFLSVLSRDTKQRHRSRVRAIIYESNKQRVCGDPNGVLANTIERQRAQLGSAVPSSTQTGAGT